MFVICRFGRRLKNLGHQKHLLRKAKLSWEVNDIWAKKLFVKVCQLGKDMIKALLDFFICTTFERASFQIGSLGAGKLSDLGTQVCRAVPQNSTHCCNVAILGTVDTFGTEELLLDHKKSLGATSCQLPQFEKLGMTLI